MHPLILLFQLLKPEYLEQATLQETTLKNTPMA